MQGKTLMYEAEVTVPQSIYFQLSWRLTIKTKAHPKRFWANFLFIYCISMIDNRA